MPEESGVSGGSRMTGGKNILVVDDEQMIREAVSSYLEKQGCHVFQAETVQEALQVFQRESVSFVILDLLLPDLSGEEVCIQIRKESRVPVIMLTAKTMETDMLNGLDIGSDDYITKHFSLKNLYARMQAVWRRTLEPPVPVSSRSIGLSYSLYILLTSRTWIAYSLFEDMGFLSSVLLTRKPPPNGAFHCSFGPAGRNTGNLPRQYTIKFHQVQGTRGCTP